MTKTKSGIILVAGPIVSIIGATISSEANNAHSTPETDWIYSSVNVIGALLIFGGVALFFYGAMWFSRLSR